MFTRFKITSFLHGEYDLMGRVYLDPEATPLEGAELELFSEETLRAVGASLGRALSRSERSFVQREIRDTSL